MNKIHNSTILFHLNKYNNGIKDVLDDYSWWIALVEKLAPKANKFEIRCWQDEQEAIATGQQFGKQQENKETEEIVFEGKINEAFLHHICTNFLDKYGGLKWFTLNFYSVEELLLHFGHYGTEPVLFVKTKEEAQQFIEWSKHYPIINRVDVEG